MNIVMQNFIRDRIFEMSDDYHKSYILDLVVSTLFAQTLSGSLYDFLSDAFAANQMDDDQDRLFEQLSFLKEHIEENGSMFSDLFVNQDWTSEEEDD